MDCKHSGIKGLLNTCILKTLAYLYKVDSVSWSVLVVDLEDWFSHGVAEMFVYFMLCSFKFGSPFTITENNLKQ